MIRIEYKNLVVDFITEEAEYTGSAGFQITRKDLQKFFDWHDNHLEYGQDYVEEFFNSDEEYFYGFITDMFILFMNWAITEETEKVFIEYSGKKFWLFHDISHAEEDVYGGIVETGGLIENQANSFALKQLEERGFEVDLTHEEIEKYAEEFLAEFREPMEMDESILFEYES